jgi:hypothetical protein
MRESQMKKIIAIAVAGAFVAPVMAADVTLSGDVEFALSATGDNTNWTNGDRDLKVVATEELDNGLTVTATLDIEDGDMASGSPDTDLKISGAFGYLNFGQSSASGAYDEVADVAETGAGTVLDDGYSDSGAIIFSPNLGVEGLSLAVSYSVVNSKSANSTTFTAVGTATAAGDDAFASQAASASTDSTGYAIQYEVNGVKFAHGSEKPEGAAMRTSVTSLSGSFGPVYVAYEMLTNNEQDAAEDWTNMGATYDYGMGKVYAERNEKDNGKSISAYGISYKVGSTLNTYIGVTDDDSTTDNTTTVGVEYAF